MANDKDKIYEQIYFLWKGEGEKRNESIDWYSEKYHVKVEDFRRWYKGISKSVKVIHVIGSPGHTSTLATDEPAEESNTVKGELPETEEPRNVLAGSKKMHFGSKSVKGLAKKQEIKGKM